MVGCWHQCWTGWVYKKEIMTLAILICTLPDRSIKLRRLLAILDPQIKQFPDRVFYRIHDGGRSMPTGTKRNQLITQTQSDYFVFIDDDDVISPDYVSEILKASRSEEHTSELQSRENLVCRLLL